MLINKIRLDFLISIISILLISTLFPQKARIHSNSDQMLDSLLFLGQFDKLSDFVQKNNYAASSPAYIESSKILLFLNSVSKKGSKILQKYIDEYNKNENSFSETVAGKKASKLYKKYLLNIERKKILESLKYYKIARYFKIRFLKNKKHKISVLLNHTFNAYNDKKYLKSSKFMSQIDSLNKDIYLAYSTKDSISRMHTLLETYFERKSISNDMWEREDTKNDFIQFLIGIGLVNQNSVSNAVIHLERIADFPVPESVRYKDYNIKSLPGTSHFFYDISLYYQIIDKLYIGTLINLTEFQYDSKTIKNFNIDFNFKERMLQYNLLLKYILRKEVGIRPYILVGTGYVKISSPASIVSILDFSISTSRLKYQIKEKTYGYGQVLFGGGVDYIPSQSSNWISGLNISFSKGFKNDKLLGNYHLRINLNFGIIF